MAAKKILVRTLVAFAFQGVQYHGNELVNFDEKDAASLKKIGSVDDHKEAIAYCKSIKIEPVDHKPLTDVPVDEESAAASGAVGAGAASGTAETGAASGAVDAGAASNSNEQA